MGGNGALGGPSRLEGLLSLLDSGSNSSVRKMAATQIGDLVAAHPSETRPVLRRVRRLLRATAWETRIAASHAIAAIAEHSPRFIPTPVPDLPVDKREEEGLVVANASKDPIGEGIALAKTEPAIAFVKTEPGDGSGGGNVFVNTVYSDSQVMGSAAKLEPTDSSAEVNASLERRPSVVKPTHRGNPILESGLCFDKLDIDRVMRGGAMLFGSSGDEYKDAETNIAAQRAKLKADLGLDDRFAGSEPMLGLKDEDLLSRAPPPEPGSNGASNGRPADVTATADVVADMQSAEGPLSARERNRRKREAKKRVKKGTDANMRPQKRPRGSGKASASGDGPEVFSLVDLVTPNEDEDEEYETEFGAEYWDFQPTCEVLKQGLLETRWEWRHGAAIGLRQILMRHPASVGRCSVGDLGDYENSRWLEDLCCRLLCVLAMDRFGDFVGDAVVAPVREAAAMTIGASSRVMSAELTRRLVDRIFYLTKTEKSHQWEVRHAALLGARYVLAVKDDMAEELLHFSFDSITAGLKDQDDDVRAVAAEALLPVAKRVILFMPLSVPGLVTTLWDALLDLDDISASTSSVLRLLSEITSHPPHEECNALWIDPKALDDSDSEEESEENGKASVQVPRGVGPVLIELVPRLWPFLRHSSKTVRRAAIILVETLTNAFSDDELLVWVRPIFSDLSARLFRNILLETEEDTVAASERVWTRALSAFGRNESGKRALVQMMCPVLQHWMLVSAQETRAEAAAYDDAQNKPKETPAARRRKAAAMRRAAKARKARSAGNVIPSTAHDSDSAPVSEGPFDAVVMQQNASKALGFLAILWPSDDFSLESILLDSLKSPLANARRVACDICGQWAASSENPSFVFSDNIRERLDKEVRYDGGCVFAEVGSSAGSFFCDSLAFLDTVPERLIGNVIDTASLKNACSEGKKAVISRDAPSAAICARSIKPHMTALVTGDTWEYLLKSLRETGMQKRRIESLESLRMRILSSIGYISVREDASRIALAASATSALVTASGIPLPQKVGPYIKALMTALRTTKNPHLQGQASSALSKLALRLSERENQKPLSLMVKNLMKYLIAPQQCSELVIKQSASSEIELDSAALAKRGSMSALRQFCLNFKDNLFDKVPWFWERIHSALVSKDHSTPNHEVNEAMTILRSLVPFIPKTLHPMVSSLLPCIVAVCAAPHTNYTQHASQCLADVVAAIPGDGMENVILGLVPLLSGAQEEKTANIYSRRGAAGALRAVVNRMSADLIPYAAFMVVPMMTRMVDEDEVVRSAAAGVFGTLVRLMPLEGGAPDDPRMSKSMAAERVEARSFLGQLLGSEPRAHYQLPVSIGGGITLRKYQQECLDWLAFLNRYGLHGALCDDMGLGKTLMTLCMIAGDFALASKSGSRLPSLVVCPSTIVGHWAEEAERFFGHALPHVLHYAGSPKNRAKFRDSRVLSKSSLVVTSYDILSNDLKHFEGIRWNYVVLDEGHVIKNPKTKVAKAVRSISANHRLILTGTPIQNSVLELWAMFDFLMPGFLGSEKSFKDAYAKPIMASRDGRCTEVDQERGMVATEALHRQVLPFILRRLKDDVLTELPPKIIQDYYCTMTPLQFRLYEDFASEMTGGEGFSASDGNAADGNSPVGAHVFQALTYLRRLCSHPKLVLTPQHPQYDAVHMMLKAEGKTINDIDSSSKLIGLKNILHDCGIGDRDAVGRDSGGHRALIFAQSKGMLDLVQSDLFQAHMPKVTYLRMDGSVEASKRQPIVSRFNADPTIDCLLLTTHVGGLGLNLTGADTVIFLEHDWNPTKDLQAMDRAHRMGQKRTVSVYRLITKGTLEEKIMGVQKFKTHIANTVVNRENSNLQSMQTEQLLDLFKVDESSVSVPSGKDTVSLGTGKGMKAALDTLGELWEENQYEEEYDMEKFLGNMGPAP